MRKIFSVEKMGTSKIKNIKFKKNLFREKLDVK